MGPSATFGHGKHALGVILTGGLWIPIWVWRYMKWRGEIEAEEAGRRPRFG